MSLTSKTDPRPSVERKIVPRLLQTLPSLGFEFIRVLAPQIFSVVHRVHAVDDHFPFADEDGRLTVFSAATGDGRVFVGLAVVAWHGRVDTKGLVNAVLKIPTRPEACKCDISWVVVRAEGGDDGLAESWQYGWVAGQEVE